MVKLNRNNKFKNKNFGEAIKHAIDGIVYAFKTQRNLRFHYITGALVLILSLFFDFTKTELICLCLTIGFVILAEMLNTAVESMVDLITDKYNEKAKIAKDVAAGGVLFASLLSVVIAYFLYIDKITQTTTVLLESIVSSPIHILAIILMIVILTVVVLKGKFNDTHKGTPLSGGMPSGHSAIAFALATYLWINTGSIVVAIVSFLMAFMISQSRVEGKIHSLVEVIAGGALGILVVVIVYQLITFKFNIGI